MFRFVEDFCTWLDEECRRINLPIELSTYDFDGISFHSAEFQDTWISTLRKFDILISTVHPPRNNFHSPLFAAQCIQKAFFLFILGCIYP